MASKRKAITPPEKEEPWAANKSKAFKSNNRINHALPPRGGAKVAYTASKTNRREMDLMSSVHIKNPRYFVDRRNNNNVPKVIPSASKIPRSTARLNTDTKPTFSNKGSKPSTSTGKINRTTLKGKTAPAPPKVPKQSLESTSSLESIFEEDEAWMEEELSFEKEEEDKSESKLLQISAEEMIMETRNKERDTLVYSFVNLTGDKEGLSYDLCGKCLDPIDKSADRCLSTCL